MSEGQHRGQDSESAGTGVTTGALARRLGVSPTTLRTWDRRYGLGPARRDPGHHRRWSERDIAMVEEMGRLTTAGVPPAEAAHQALKLLDPEGASRRAPEPAAVPRQRGPARAAPVPSPDTFVRRRRGLSRAAVRLDAPTMQDLLTDAVESHSLVTAWQEVMVPTLHAVGRRWEEAGDRYVEVEHLLSWHVSRTLHRSATAPVAPVPPSSPAASAPLVLACVPGEQHSLPLEALSAALGELGVPQRMFGAAVPVEAVSSAVRRTGPAVVVLWAQARSTASVPLARHIADTRWGVRGARGRSVVMLGGPGWAGPAVRGALRPTSLREALAQISRVRGEGAPA
ncbi:MerR family transcriptional regulator [Streptomyces durmitorensis]|uniref:MerR family transcriptional regulator n=1 Tax=Streptomyces durmitorensis TaxID=319947 RepID=A0ABY4Q4H1_9ACTN|nr:MerR family transcriptional regulator [Streptomyces durmitorensis]UQT60626.1 MerR family transcriptional regulator [Streptomyces durmitorensis]